jgi:NADH:ubiquinone reductase (non-electrogenic)
MRDGKKKVVILGSGFAALSIVKKIDLAFYDIDIISPRNHFLFTPLLPSTTVGTIEFRSIIEPIRTSRNGIKYFQASCVVVSTKDNIVVCETVQGQERFELEYDYLVIAVGAVNNTFGIPGVHERAMFLKELTDARNIRGKIISNFERASNPGMSIDERKRLLHFVVAGGGPTGVEFAAELNDFIREDLVNWYPERVLEVRITLLEAAKQILNSFDAELGEYAMRLFKRESIDIKTSSPVREIREKEILLQDGTAVPYGLLVWSTGIGPTELVKSLALAKNPASRLLTDNYLRVAGTENIYAAGDCGTPISGVIAATGQAAQQEGKFLARNFNNMAHGKPAAEFRYHNLGMLAYIGRRRALADLPNVKGKGFGAFLFWRSAYLTRLVSVKNKILVLFDWLKTSFFGRDISSF